MVRFFVVKQAIHTLEIRLSELQKSMRHFQDRSRKTQTRDVLDPRLEAGEVVGPRSLLLFT